MKKTLSLLLALALVVSLVVPTTLAIQASAEDSESTDNGMVINKTATYNKDTNDYTITLEAYATGSKVISEVKKDVPTDIVLVIDQSGSMAYDIAGVSYSAYSGNAKKNSNLYKYRHNGGSGNLWYRASDGQYYSVSVALEQQKTYQAYPANTSHDTYKDNENNLYAKVNGTYERVTIVSSGLSFIGIPNKYEYRLPSGNVIATATRKAGSNVWNLSSVSGTEDGLIYQLVVDNSKDKYTYSYTYNGITTVIGSSTGVDTQFGTTLYSKSKSATEPRLDALMRAATNFVNNVNTKAKGADGLSGTADDVNHRIAVVGFDSNKYNNTELLTGVTISTGTYNYGTSPVNDYSSIHYYPKGYSKDGVQYASLNQTHYSAAFQSMNLEAGYNNVKAAIDALTARGGTYTNLGIDMANKIFEYNPIAADETRQRVVIVFTDGIPGTSGFEADRASSAISQAAITKTTYGATVYTIGIFDGADATQKGSTGEDSSDADKGNYVCQQISSNNGEVRSPSYYLSAGNSASLNNIFQQIADQIETGGTSTTLDENTVIKDIIAPQFQLPAGATASNITLETYACTGKTNGEYTWSKNPTAMGAKAAINATSGNVDVTGFNFAENYVGTVTENGNATYRGHKLVIKFNVETKDGFLGGNDVFTNTSAGVYENAAATEPVMTFPRPTVNVPIQNVTVTAQDKNVYLLGDLTAEQIKSGATVNCGNVSLDLSKADQNYGLETWQNEYVDISVTYTDASGNEVTKLEDLQADTTYTVTAKVTPKTDGSTTNQGSVATEKSGSANGNIYVFKPQLTFKDSEVYYGDKAPANYTGNLTGIAWKHGDTAANNMIGTEPTLDLAYKPGEGVADGKIATKQDIPVDVTVKIDGTDVTSQTKFVHTKCNPSETDPANGKFWLHVKTCSLTIVKQAATGTTFASDEYFVFNIQNDGKDYTQVTIHGAGSVTISQLPVGEYTVTEDQSTAWRYTPTMTNGKVTLSSTNTSATVTCTNEKTNDKWLNHFAQVINTYGKTNDNT